MPDAAPAPVSCRCRALIVPDGSRWRAVSGEREGDYRCPDGSPHAPAGTDRLAARLAEVRERCMLPAFPWNWDLVAASKMTSDDLPRLLAAVEAVLMIHASEPEPGLLPPTCVVCQTIPDSWSRDEWPCPTVQAITTELLGEEEGGNG